MKPVIELRNVSKSYGKFLAVNDITLQTMPGTVQGFIGPNGAGKTTTISMLVDIIRPSAGSISVFGLDSVKNSLEIRKRIGFLAGDFALDRGLTGWQQLEYFGHLHGSFDRTYVLELAQRFSCDLNKKFKALSRGNKQKVGLISALMNKPELLILDEPTSGLDPLMQEEFNKIILDHKKAGMTAFISSHVLSEVQEICDEVALIKDGKLLTVEHVAELTAVQPRLVTVKTTDKTLKKRLSDLPGVKMQKSTNGTIECTYLGEIYPLISLLSKHKLADVSIEPANLERVFMKYYGSSDV